MGAALLLAMAPGLPAAADEPTTSTTGAASSGAGEQQAAATTPALPTPASTGVRYGGRSTGPAPLITLPEDPAYPVPEPPGNENLPEEVDVSPPWQENLVCDPVDRPGLTAFGNLVGEHFGRPGYTTSRACIDMKSEHYDGRAVDWQLNAYDPHDRRIGDAVVTWLTDNDGEVARRFGIQSIIWNERVWRAYDTVGWQGYTGQSPHTDHIHVSFTWDGANMRTSWWTGVAVTEPDLGPCRVVPGEYAAIPLAPRLDPCEVPQPVAVPQTGYSRVRPGGAGAGVELMQPLLEVEPTGVLDDATRAALLAWQEERGIPATGVLDQLTYAAALEWELAELPEAALAVPLDKGRATAFTPHRRTVLEEGDRGEAVALLQKSLGVEADGIFGPITAEALAAYTEEHPLLRPAEQTSGLLWHLLELEAHPTMPYREHEVLTGDQGRVVEILQEFLGVEADGVFGPITEQAVRDAQELAELEVTGVVDASTWASLEDLQRLREAAEKEAAEKAAAKKAAEEKAAKEAAAKKAAEERAAEQDRLASERHTAAR